MTAAPTRPTLIRHGLRRATFPLAGGRLSVDDVSLPHPGGKVPPKGADEGELQRAVGLLLLRQLLIHPHQLRHAGALAVQLPPKAICLHHGLVVSLMSFS